MSRLRDMEQLLESILDSQIEEYMREAYECYAIGATRACIVLSFIAMFENILRKLEELAKDNPRAKVVYDQAEALASDQKVFERFLIEKLAAEELIPKADATFLSILRELRNKSAHPSGHAPSAEEARFVFSESISRFLSKDVLSSSQLVEVLISKLGDRLLFGSRNPEEGKAIASSLLKPIHEAALPRLVSQLVKALKDGDSQVRENASLFIWSMALLKNDVYRTQLRKRLLVDKSSDHAYERVVIGVVSADPSLVVELDPVIRIQVRAAIVDVIKTIDATEPIRRLSHPCYALASIVKTCGDEYSFSEFEREIREFVTRFPFSWDLLEAAQSSPKVAGVIGEVLCELAGTSEFKTSNWLARNLPTMDEGYAKSLTSEACFLLLSNVMKAAFRDTFEAKALFKGAFAQTPALRSKACDFLSADPVAAEAKFGEVTLASHRWKDAYAALVSAGSEGESGPSKEEIDADSSPADEE